MKYMLTAWVILYLMLFAFLTYQDWQLRKRLRSRAWNWEIAGVTIAFLGTAVRYALSESGLLDRPVLIWLLFATTTGAIVCLIISRHLLHKSLESLFKK
jgi:hypothetical protein